MIVIARVRVMVLLVYECLESCLARGHTGYLPMFFTPEIDFLYGSRLSLEDSITVGKAMTKFVRKFYEQDFQSEIAEDEEEMKRVSKLIPECLKVSNH